MVSLSLARRFEGCCRDTLWCGKAPLEAFKQGNPLGASRSGGCLFSFMFRVRVNDHIFESDILEE